jgi:outer membrane protein assembly factor BamD
MSMRKLYIYLLIASFSAISCRSEFQKTLKSNDYNKKYESAIQYFNKKDYLRSQQLFESILPVYKGTEKDETINYYIAQCNYKNEDYTMASYYLKSFVNTFPNSDKAEECRYLTGYCYYKSSPKYSLDQEYSKDAIEEFQVYLSKYPKGVNVEYCNQYITELKKKIEKKAFLNSKTYFDMEQYKAATVSFKNFLNSYPESDYKEETMFLLVKSGYLMASNSIATKQFERYESVVSDYESYIDEYPNGKHVKDAEKYFIKSQEFIKKSKL